LDLAEKKMAGILHVRHFIAGLGRAENGPNPTIAQ
jgi:hypothetical protein